MKLGDIKGEFQADELTGTFNALNETTNVRPSKGESISVVHPTFKKGYDTGPIGSPVELNSLDVGPVNKTADKGWWTVDGADFRDSELDALNETTNFDDKGYSPISGEGVFKPQDIDAKGSVIWGDNHFTPDRGGDSLTGEGRPTKIWTNGGASTFEDRHVGDYDANDAVFSMRENIDWTAANGGPGSSYLTAKNASQNNAYVDEDVDGFMKLGDIKGELQTTDLRSDNRFVIERFEPAAGMNRFGESLNPVLEVGGTAGPGASTFMTEKTGANPGQMLSPLSGGDGCPF